MSAPGTPAPAAGAAAPAAGFDGDLGCSGGEAFALRVIGTDMAPEFADGEIVIVEPDGALKDGSFVLAQAGDEWLLRQLARGATGWVLRALNPACRHKPEIALADLSSVRGVVIQKAVPGRRCLSKFYV